MIDKYQREIIDNGEGIYSVTGIEIISTSFDNALATFNAMPPGDWTEPAILEPLDVVGALATLLVVVGTLDINDAANAVRLTPDDLVAEAEAWKIASNQLHF